MAQACDMPKPTSTPPWAESFDNQRIARYRDVNHECLADPLKPTNLALLLVNRQGNVMYIPIQEE